MTIQTILDDGTGTRTTTYRNVFKSVNLAQYREGFEAQAEHCKWGVLYQLKGKERILLARFGRQPNEMA